MKVKLLEEHGDFKEGEEVEFSNLKAARLIRIGRAESIVEEEPKKTVTKSTVKKSATKKGFFGGKK